MAAPARRAQLGEHLGGVVTALAADDDVAARQCVDVVARPAASSRSSPAPGAAPPALRWSRRTPARSVSKSPSACMRSISTEPTMPRQPTSPTNAMSLPSCPTLVRHRRSLSVPPRLVSPGVVGKRGERVGASARVLYCLGCAIAATTASPISRVPTGACPRTQMSRCAGRRRAPRAPRVSMRSAASGLLEGVAEHHRGGEDCRDGIGDALARDVGRGAVARLVQALVVGVQRGRGQHAERAGEHAASSERMSPNMFPVTMTSNFFGAFTSCIAALSTYMWSSSTSGYCACTSVTTSRQNWTFSSTLALSTLVSACCACAAWNATCAMRSISGGVAHRVEASSAPGKWPSTAVRRPRGWPK